jgi:lipoprotein-releasing system permease protein
MRIAWFIAKRTAFAGKRSFSRLIIRIATVAVALSVAVMLISTALIQGFQQEISEKVFGFWGHIQVTRFDRNVSYERLPVHIGVQFDTALADLPGIRHMQRYATRPGILKVGEDIDGIIVKGVSTDFDSSFIIRHLKAGRLPDFGADSISFEVLISQRTAQRMKVWAGDALPVNFLDPETMRIRSRRFTISGIYHTGLDEYDRLFALADIRQIQVLNGWGPDEVGGFEMFVEDIDKLEEVEQNIWDRLDPNLRSATIRQLKPTIFDWLELQTTNEVVILALMVIVAVINMITALLILILERTNMIGILKAIGARDWTVRRVFLYHALYILGLGLLVGNVLGLGLAVLQMEFGFISLPEETYYVSKAPIALNTMVVAAINLGTLLVCLLVLILPSYLVTRIRPIRAIRFS